ncbi:hypothetical protein OG978_45720 (plasmid) [Streptomyces sp. NBC_01591]|nr:hypothetical protein [Streptomyces sp. NBC_01591]WSD74360.1 hypothetical protein OG978_45720 [Streptomyces sp. NBC_01591]
MFDALRAAGSGGMAQFRIGVTREGDSLSVTVTVTATGQAGQAYLRG